jgi:hypothetical protein
MEARARRGAKLNFLVAYLNTRAIVGLSPRLAVTFLRSLF